MTAFNEFTKRVNVLGGKIRSEIRTCDYLEDAAQKFSELMYREFSNSIILTRVFVTIPFSKLPSDNQNFVIKIADSAGIRSQIRDNTLVLSLLGTQGQNEDWNNRRNSKKHAGIPLISDDFIDSISMMSRLLKELGIRLDWLADYDAGIVKKKLGRLSGLFYVQDAANTTDDRGRKVISAQDFVKTYNIKTVFGMGGGYSVRGIYSVMINFTKKNLPQRGAERFMTFINFFNGETGSLVADGKFFRS